MLKKKYRLPANVRMKRAKKISSKYFFLNTEDNGLACSRFAFVISKKVDKRAVVRNRIKRKLTEIININLEKIKIGMDMIFILRKEAALDIPGLCETAKDVLRKEGILA